MSESRSSFSAYYWPTSQRININDKDGVPGALTIRNRSTDKRAGDCWCHEECYKNGTGTRMYPYDYESGPSNTRNHFKRERGETSRHPTRGRISTGGCTVKRRVKLLKEDGGSNNYYEQFFSDLKAELVGSSNMWDNIDKYYIQRVEFPQKNQRNASDLIIHHTPGGDREATHVVIVNMSYNRTLEENLYDATQGRTRLNTILIWIRRWTDEHISDFAGQGKRMFEEKWDDLEDDIIQHNEQAELDRKREQERARKEAEDRNNALYALNKAMAEARIVLDDGIVPYEDDDPSKDGVHGGYGFNEDNLSTSVIDLRSNISNAQSYGIDTTLAEDLLGEAAGELETIISERMRRSGRRALARGYIPRFEIIGITPPDPTDDIDTENYRNYEDVISLFEQHEDEIVAAEDELAEEQRLAKEADVKRRANEAANAHKARQDWVAQGNDLLQELETNRTTYKPTMEILSFAAGARISGVREDGIDRRGVNKPHIITHFPSWSMSHSHIKLLRIVLLSPPPIRSWLLKKPDVPTPLEMWVDSGADRFWNRIGIVPISLRKNIMVPGNLIQHEELFKNARAELDAILPAYKAYFKGLETDQEENVREAEELLDTHIHHFESKLDKLDPITLKDVLNITEPLETACSEYAKVPGAKTSVIGSTKLLVKGAKDRATEEDDRRAKEKAERLEVERSNLVNISSEFDEIWENITNTINTWNSLSGRITELIETEKNTVKFGNECNQRISNEISYSEIHCPSDLEENRTNIEKGKDEISELLNDAKWNVDFLTRYNRDHLRPLVKVMKDLVETSKNAQMPDGYWEDEISDRRADLEKRIKMLDGYKELEELWKQAQFVLETETQGKGVFKFLLNDVSINSTRKIREEGGRVQKKIEVLKDWVVELCDNRLSGTVKSKFGLKGYCFIEADFLGTSTQHSENEFYFHGSNNASIFNQIKNGCEVKFEPVQGKAGRWKAINLRHYSCSQHPDIPIPSKEKEE